jgi:PAS domain S-box-containing protein
MYTQPKTNNTDPIVPLRVLIVEDSEDDTLLLTRLLRNNGYQLVYHRVETRADMETALADREWDLVISDYSMPSFGGMGALDVLKASGLDLPFIIVSGVIGEESAVAAMKAGAHDYLMKGNLNRLAPAIERELRDAEERRARRQAELQVRKLSLALMQSASLVMITDITGRIEYVNYTFVRVTGFRPEEVIGAWVSFFEAEHDQNTRFDQLVHDVLAVGEWRGELHNRKRNGDLYWAAVTVSLIRDGDAKPVNLLIVQEDITHRKHLEGEVRRYTEELERMVDERTAELRHAKEQMDVILNNSNDAILLAESTGDIIKVNPAFQRAFGSQVDRAVEQLFNTLANTDQLDTLAKALIEVIYDHKDARIEANLQREDGRVIDGDLAFAPVYGPGEARAGLVMSMRDITHLKEIDRFKMRLIANAAHDLSNPIAVLKMRLYLMKQTPERHAEHMRVLEQQIKRMENLVGDLRTLSEIDRGIKLDMETVDLNHLVSEVVETLQPLAVGKQQELSFAPFSRLPLTMVDRRKFERVIVNLVANALNYTPVSGRIQVSTFAETSVVGFTVSDTGMGIEASDIPYLFERFYRSANAKQHDAAGTGLGLAIVKEMTDAHGGRVNVESESGQGSRFTVSLPIRR